MDNEISPELKWVKNPSPWTFDIYFNAESSNPTVIKFTPGFKKQLPKNYAIWFAHRLVNEILIKEEPVALSKTIDKFEIERKLKEVLSDEEPMDDFETIIEEPKPLEPEVIEKALEEKSYQEIRQEAKAAGINPQQPKSKLIELLKK